MTDPLAAPEWFVAHTEELSRKLTSSPKSVADGLWAELIRRNLVNPQVVPGRVLGPLGWKKTLADDTLREHAIAAEAAAMEKIEHG